jgi:hypothetical protein
METRQRRPLADDHKRQAADGATLRQSPEHRYGGELERLAAHDGDPKPPGWRLSAKAVRRFIIGDEALGVMRKFYGDDALVDRAIVTLIGAQGLMLVGEPGTAKSMLSELLATAISGTSDLVVQGSAGTTEDHVRYSWNYALLLAQGPTEAALVLPSRNPPLRLRLLSRAKPHFPGRSSNGGFWSRKVENMLSFNGD